MEDPRVEKVLGFIGANVRRLRLQRGLTQEQLAEAADARAPLDDSSRVSATKRPR